jgi:hypothetical protein
VTHGVAKHHTASKVDSELYFHPGRKIDKDVLTSARPRRAVMDARVAVVPSSGSAAGRVCRPPVYRGGRQAAIRQAAGRADGASPVVVGCGAGLRPSALSDGDSSSPDPARSVIRIWLSGRSPSPVDPEELGRLRTGLGVGPSATRREVRLRGTYVANTVRSSA